ncbi:hypothetical protein BGX20_006303 [Mortierella sp. AD010]|nr:hypothetical protein BGX20_006303 [Mortierella sp. AD010]
MEEHFLLWKAKVHNGQIAQQEDLFHEGLVKQDHVTLLEVSCNDSVLILLRFLIEWGVFFLGYEKIEESEEDLNFPREEVIHLRNRLLILEYEDRYVGSVTLLSDGDITSISSSNFNYNNSDDNNNEDGEQGLQAAKMESTVYTEMMHEVVLENDELRKKLKNAQRKLRRYGEKSQDHRGNNNSGTDDGGDGVYGSEDDMEEIIIIV